MSALPARTNRSRSPSSRAAPPVWTCLLAAACLSGCANSPTPSSGAAPGAIEPAASAPGGPRLDEQVQGKVVSVNPTLRFVVMDFNLRRMPVLDQRLHVYRALSRVGEVKVTGPTLESTTAGDLTAGEARVGDEVRED